MQYNGKFLNPYDVLGLPWASDIELVKATYRSLVKIYHPDIFKGDKDFAEKRLAQLNVAYEFLSDPEQKREFDRNEQSENQDERQQDFDPDRNSSEFDEGINILKENWDFACDYYPELTKLYKDLGSIGREPAFAFMAFVVETKEYAQAKSIAETLEDAFLTTKFSDDQQIKQIAKAALLQNEIKFAKELNRALKILGSDAKDKILMKLSVDFPDFTYRAYNRFKCGNLISYNNPLKVKEREEEQEKNIREQLKKRDAKLKEKVNREEKERRAKIRELKIQQELKGESTFRIIMLVLLVIFGLYIVS